MHFFADFSHGPPRGHDRAAATCNKCSMTERSTERTHHGDPAQRVSDAGEVGVRDLSRDGCCETRIAWFRRLSGS